jgi:hypothetical protein
MNDFSGCKYIFYWIFSKYLTTFGFCTKKTHAGFRVCPIFDKKIVYAWPLDNGTLQWRI